MDLDTGVIEILEAIELAGGLTVRLNELIIFGPFEGEGAGRGEEEAPGDFIFMGGGTNTVLTCRGLEVGVAAGEEGLGVCGLKVAICLGAWGLCIIVPNL